MMARSQAVARSSWILDSNLNSAAWPKSCNSLSAQKQNKLCGVWIHFRIVELVEDAKTETHCKLFPMLIPHNEAGCSLCCRGNLATTLSGRLSASIVCCLCIILSADLAVTLRCRQALSFPCMLWEQTAWALGGDLVNLINLYSGI